MNLDTLEMLQELEDKGFTPSQAEGIVEQIMGAVANSDWVTKDFLRAELAELKTELKTETAQLETRVMGKIESIKTDLIKWMVCLLAAVLGFILALMGLNTGLLYFLLKN
jgi:hypothetical protein